MTLSASLHRTTRATARTMRVSEEHRDFGVCSFCDADGNEVKVFTTPAAAQAIADAFNAAIAATPADEAA